MAATPLKSGAEFRRQNTDSFSYTPGTFTFASDQPLPGGSGHRLHRQHVQSLQPRLRKFVGRICHRYLEDDALADVTLGLRYDWYGTPTEAENRFVVFDPTTDTLQHVGQSGGPRPCLQPKRVELPAACRFCLESI